MRPDPILAFDSLAELLAELAPDEMRVAEIVDITNALVAKGVTAAHVRALVAVGFVLGPEGLRPKLPEPKAWYTAVQRWPVGCRRCSIEVKRGELGSLGKLRDGTWVVECAGCREVDQRSERAENARRWAVEKEMSVAGDPEELIERMVEHAPEQRDEIEDLLMAVVAAAEGE